MDVGNEIQFKTTRGGGKGGQNVNKVETAVIASFLVKASAVLNEEQKSVVAEKLSNRINTEGFLQLKSQAFRTQLENKADAVKKINDLIIRALHKKKARIATGATRGSVERRIEWKKKNSQIKESRRKIKPY